MNEIIDANEMKSCIQQNEDTGAADHEWTQRQPNNGRINKHGNKPSYHPLFY